jgi:uncharacterized RDD family membrane protein YckC
MKYVYAMFVDSIGVGFVCFAFYLGVWHGSPWAATAAALLGVLPMISERPNQTPTPGKETL